MHCSGRYSGTGVQVFSALPVVQQRAQVDIGQKSGILQMKHAPTALTCHGGPRRSSTICGVEGVAKPGSAPVASRILRYQPYTGLDPLLPRIRTVCAIPALPSISCDDGTHLCPACPCPSTHAPPPNHGSRAAFQSLQFCARTTAPRNSTNANPNSMEYPATCAPYPLCRRHSCAAPSNPMPLALLCLIYYDARSHSIHIFLSFLLPPHLL